MGDPDAVGFSAGADGLRAGLRLRIGNRGGARVAIGDVVDSVDHTADLADGSADGIGNARMVWPQHFGHAAGPRSEEHTSELQSLMRISYAVFCLKKKKKKKT